MMSKGHIQLTQSVSVTFEGIPQVNEYFRCTAVTEEGWNLLRNASPGNYHFSTFGNSNQRFRVELPGAIALDVNNTISVRRVD